MLIRPAVLPLRPSLTPSNSPISNFPFTGLGFTILWLVLPQDCTNVVVRLLAHWLLQPSLHHRRVRGRESLAFCHTCCHRAAKPITPNLVRRPSLTLRHLHPCSRWLKLLSVVRLGYVGRTLSSDKARTSLCSRVQISGLLSSMVVDLAG